MRPVGARENGAEAAPVPIKVLIVDDQPFQRMGMRMFLGGQDDIEVLGEAADGRQAVQQAQALQPDVVLMDIRMPGTDGISATRQIVEKKSTTTGPWVLLLTTFDLDEYVLAGLEAGASGFLTKDAEPPDLLSAVRAVAAGDAVIAPSATRRLIDRLASRASLPTVQQDAREGAAVGRLTGREKEILVAIGRGMTNSEIAGLLVLAESTVKSYVGKIFVKIGARDRVHAVIIAYRAGLVTVDG
ncbi:response regulator transcription factor [Myceligenerans cantabricum]